MRLIFVYAFRMARGAGPTVTKKKSAGGKDCPASDVTVFGEENFQGKTETFEERHSCCYCFSPPSDYFPKEKLYFWLT